MSRITVLYYTTQAFGGSVNQDGLIEKKGAQEIPTKKRVAIYFEFNNIYTSTICWNCDIAKQNSCSLVNY